MIYYETQTGLVVLLFVPTKNHNGLFISGGLGDCFRVIAERRRMALSKLMAHPWADECFGLLLRKHALVNTSSLLVTTWGTLLVCGQSIRNREEA